MILFILDFTISASGRTNGCPEKSGAAHSSQATRQCSPLFRKPALLEKVVEAGFRGAVPARDELLGRAVGQERLDLDPVGVQLALPSAPGPAKPHADLFLGEERLGVRLEIKSRSISAAIEKAMARILLCRLPVSCHSP
jgi:hypothetical protein